jgi:dihydrofolate synthase/folylpolyglutamate synthase
MTYPETLAWLLSQLPMYHRIGAAAYKADLTNTLMLCNLLGEPQRSFPSVHVAGTNGKGSVSHMLASVLQEHGLKTGLHTSPHLKDFRERIRVDGLMISKRGVAAFVNRYRKDFETIRPSFFEMVTLMAFDHFRREAVDIAVIEAGMGGRLDSTNVLTPLLSVITNISFDHMQFLGDTLEKIASEKAGIIKPGVPVVIGETQEESKKVFLEKARSSGSEIIFADQEWSVRESDSPRRHKDTKDQTVFPHSRFFDLYKNDVLRFEKLEIPLMGEYQKKNIITLMGACKALENSGIKIQDDQIRRGIENVIRNTGLSGRWQVLSRDPLTICDTGHNLAGISMVLDQIRHTPHRHLHMVFGIVNDKDITPILKILPENATYYFCKADIPRGLDAHVLEGQARNAGLNGRAYPSARTALNAAKKEAEPDDLIFIGGSTFVVAEVL